MDYTITYYSENVQADILNLSDTLAVRYIVLTRIKKAQKTPPRDRRIAEARMKEVKHANS